MRLILILIGLFGCAFMPSNGLTISLGLDIPRKDNRRFKFCFNPSTLALERYLESCGNNKPDRTYYFQKKSEVVFEDDFGGREWIRITNVEYQKPGHVYGVKNKTVKEMKLRKLNPVDVSDYLKYESDYDAFKKQMESSPKLYTYKGGLAQAIEYYVKFSDEYNQYIETHAQKPQKQKQTKKSQTVAQQSKKSAKMPSPKGNMAGWIVPEHEREVMHVHNVPEQVMIVPEVMYVNKDSEPEVFFVNKKISGSASTPKGSGPRITGRKGLDYATMQQGTVFVQRTQTPYVQNGNNNTLGPKNARTGRRNPARPDGPVIVN